MTSSLLYFSANLIAQTAILLIGAACLISNPRSLNARLFAGVALSSASYLFGRLSYAIPPEVQIHTNLWPFLLILMNAGMGLWMILAHQLFQDEKPIPRWIITAYAVQLSLSTVNAFGYIGRDNSILQSSDYPYIVNLLFGPLPIALQASFALLALYWTLRDWRADLDESRRLLRSAFLLVFGMTSLVGSLTELALVNADYATRAPFDNALTLILSAGYLTLAVGVLRFDHRVLDRVATRAPQPDTTTTNHDLAALMRALSQQKIYLTPGLTIAGLAKHLAMPEYRLRALINRQLGYRNFNALLHDYRLRDIRAQLADPARANIPILTIALEAGYQSITPFNQAFREAMGCTPTAWRRQHGLNPEISS